MGQLYMPERYEHFVGQSHFLIDFAQSIGAKQVYYHSISHLTRKTHEEIQAMLPPHHLLAYDGLIIT